uniref:Mechanosensitive ion channel MscS domain-containing protein n=1 Tax=Chromulina nebulosa TaxID=96789 RepID=A0A7S0SSL5_9STRA|mmetsp:Transcript_2977/g.2634  ORF Transcript_2977/g.2634 Transcript_2977/m.2634 type:complete len:435 (+) Transcript_2977:34-1338(+)
MHINLTLFIIILNISLTFAFNQLKPLNFNKLARNQVIMSASAPTASTINSILHKEAEIFRHSLYIGGTFRQLSNLFSTGESSSKVLGQIRSILDPIDISILVIFVTLCKPTLRLLYGIANGFKSSKDKIPFERSFFGYLDEPVKYSAIFLPSLYIFDIFSVVLKSIGLATFGKWDVIILIHAVSVSFVIGKYVTKFKDWILQEKFRHLRGYQHLREVQHIDSKREATIDELSSLALWFIVIFFQLEILSKKFGFGLGSVFALGGIGSASIVLALRSTFENFAGGVLLKLQDKFREKESISIRKGDEGEVLSINYLTTAIRKTDNSIINVPNHIFTQSEIINWSRTPYRKFETVIALPATNYTDLPKIIADVKESLSALPEVDTIDRELVVGATSFDGKDIKIKVDLHFIVSNEKDAALLQTKVVGILASICKKS